MPHWLYWNKTSKKYVEISPGEKKSLQRKNTPLKYPIWTELCSVAEVFLALISKTIDLIPKPRLSFLFKFVGSVVHYESEFKHICHFSYIVICKRSDPSL